MMTAAQIEEAVELLIAARGDHRRLDAFPPSCRPVTFEDGHAVQEAFVNAWSVPVAGYKIGCTSEEAQKLLGSPGPFPGRVFAPVLLRSPATMAAKAPGRAQSASCGHDLSWTYATVKRAGCAVDLTPATPRGPPAAPLRWVGWRTGFSWCLAISFK